MEDVRPWVRGPVDPERLLVCGRRAHHAQAAVVVDVLGAERDPRELPGQVGDLGGERRPAVHRECIAPIRILDATDLRDDALESDVPRHRPERIAAPISHERRDQTVGVRDLLIGDDALGTELHLVDVVIAGLEAEHATLRVDLEVHPALHPAEAAVGRDESHASLVRAPTLGRLGTRLSELPHPRRYDRQRRTLTRPAHRKPPFTSRRYACPRSSRLQRGHVSIHSP